MKFMLPLTLVTTGGPNFVQKVQDLSLPALPLRSPLLGPQLCHSDCCPSPPRCSPRHGAPLGQGLPPCTKAHSYAAALVMELLFDKVHLRVQPLQGRAAVEGVMQRWSPSAECVSACKGPLLKSATG